MNEYALESENARLKAEVEQWQKQVCEQGEVIEAFKNKLEMAEACLAGDNALIEGLKAELAAAQKDAFRAGMLAAADVLKQQFYKTQDECEQAIREAAKK